MRLIFVLLLFSIAYAQPPIDNVFDHNTDESENLDGVYNSSIAKHQNLVVTFGNTSDRSMNVSASMEIAGLNLLLDNMTYPVDELSLIVARGTKESHLVAWSSEGYPDFECDFDWFWAGANYAWRCDFDGDDCVEYVNRSWIIYDIDAIFTFRNVSEVAPMESNIIEVPEGIRELMQTSSGSEYLNVSLEGNVIFNYEFNDRKLAGVGCTSSYFTDSVSIPFSISASYRVAGAQKHFFVRSPVLREQWFRNNQFNTVVLSQIPLYYATIYENNVPVVNYTLREFNVTTDRFGLQHIISNKLNGTKWSEYENLTTPTPLDLNNYSYAFIYEFNHSYQGIGKNTLKLSVNDSFLESAEYEEKLLSRMLSYNGTNTETGGTYNPEITRKSAGFEKGKLTNLEISIGFLAALLILAFVNFWNR
jgi:hypothetical protein